MSKLYQEMVLSITLLFIYCLLIISELNQAILLKVLALAPRFAESFPNSPEQKYANIPVAILELKAVKETNLQNASIEMEWDRKPCNKIAKGSKLSGQIMHHSNTKSCFAFQQAEKKGDATKKTDITLD